MLDLRPDRELNTLVIIALSLIGAFVVALIISLFIKQKRAALILRVVGLVGAFASILIALYAALTFDSLIIISAFVVFITIAGAIIFYFAKLKDKSPLAILVRGLGALLILSAIAILLYSVLYITTQDLERITLWGLFIVVSIVALAITFIMLAKKFPISFNTKDITVAGVLLALAIALSYVGARMPQGGRVTLASSLAIMIFAYFWGLRKGSIMVVAFLAFQFIQGIWILHFWSLLLDYIVPYLALIAFGIFSHKRVMPWNSKIIKIETGQIADTRIKKRTLSRHANFFIAFSIYLLVRYFSHVLSGILFFGEWAPVGHTAITWAFLYNTFFLLDAAIALLGGVVLLSSKHFNRFMTTTANALQNANTAHKDDKATAAATNERERETCWGDTACYNSDVDKSLNSDDSGDSASEIATESIGGVLSDSDSASN